MTNERTLVFVVGLFVSLSSPSCGGPPRSEPHDFVSARARREWLRPSAHGMRAGGPELAPRHGSEGAFAMSLSTDESQRRRV